jgi:DNA-binding transcriptional LysR family regulator
LSIILPDPFLHFFAPPVLGEFGKFYPGIDVSLRVSGKPRRPLHPRPAAEDIDVVAPPIMDNPIVVLAGPDHPLAQKNIRLQRLAREPRLTREKGSGTRIAIGRRFAEHGIALHPRLQLGGSEAIKQAILAAPGDLSDVAPRASVEPAGSSSVVLDVEGVPACAICMPL